MAAAPGAGPPDPGASALLSRLQVAMATGQVLFHRFFYSKSFVKHSFEVRAAGARGKGRPHPEMGVRGGASGELSRNESGSFGPRYLVLTPPEVGACGMCSGA